MKKLVLTLLALPVFSLIGLGYAPVPNSATLLITKTPGAEADTIQYDLTGANAMSFQFFVVDDQKEDFTFEIEGKLVELGVAPPFLPLPVGFADMRGDLSFSVEIPTDIALGHTLFIQAVGITIPMDTPFFSIPLDFCTSNVASLDL